MKKKTYFIIFSLLLFGLGIFLLVDLFYVTKEDQLQYQALLKKAYMPATNRSFLNVKQERIGVHKEIWLSKSSGRHEIHVESPYSEIIIVNQDMHATIQEKLKSAHFVMQDKLYFEQGKPIQDVRRIFAESANFSYQDRLFIGENVSLSTFSCEGHRLPKKLSQESLTMKGKASKIYFNVNDEAFNFNAKNLKANFYPKSDL